MPSTPASAIAAVATHDDLILPLHAVVVYSDMTAGKHAIGVLKRMGAHLQDEFKMVLWRFDLIAVPRWRAIATDDVAAAGLVVFATSEADQLPDHINDWMEECLARKRGEIVAMLTLFGKRETWAVWLQDLLQINTKRQGPTSWGLLPSALAVTNTLGGLSASSGV
jgi:hypothetical protein